MCGYFLSTLHIEVMCIVHIIKLEEEGLMHHFNEQKDEER